MTDDPQDIAEALDDDEIYGDDDLDHDHDGDQLVLVDDDDHDTLTADAGVGEVSAEEAAIHLIEEP